MALGRPARWCVLGAVLVAVGVGEHGVVDVAGETALDLVVLGYVPGVGDVQLGQAAVHVVAAVVEPPGDVLAVRLGEVHRDGPVGRLARPDRLGEPGDAGIGLGLDGDPVLLGVGGGTPLRLLPGFGVAPALLGFLGVLGQLV